MGMEPPSFTIYCTKEQRASAAPQNTHFLPRRFARPVLSKVTVVILVLMLGHHYVRPVAARYNY